MYKMTVGVFFFFFLSISGVADGQHQLIYFICRNVVMSVMNDNKLIFFYLLKLRDVGFN